MLQAASLTIGQVGQPRILTAQVAYLATSLREAFLEATRAVPLRS